MTKRKGKTTPAAKFKPGEKVRVRRGVRDTDYPDMPLGGWTGNVAEVHGGGMYTIQWNKETLASIHPVFKARCEKDGLTLDQYCLGDDDLEPDVGGPLNIEQPQEIMTKPLSPKDQDDRIRMVFGLTSNDPLPDVDNETLVAYYEHLLKNLVFPFTAEQRVKYGPPEPVKVVGIGDPGDAPMIDDEYGILCDAKRDGRLVNVPISHLDGVTSKSNRQLVKDYCCWFHNWR